MAQGWNAKYDDLVPRRSLRPLDLASYKVCRGQLLTEDEDRSTPPLYLCLLPLPPLSLLLTSVCAALQPYSCHIYPRYAAGSNIGSPKPSLTPGCTQTPTSQPQAEAHTPTHLQTCTGAGQWRLQGRHNKPLLSVGGPANYFKLRSEGNRTVAGRRPASSASLGATSSAVTNAERPTTAVA